MTPPESLLGKAATSLNYCLESRVEERSRVPFVRVYIDNFALLAYCACFRGFMFHAVSGGAVQSRD